MKCAFAARWLLLVSVWCICGSSSVLGQTVAVTGTVRDETGGALPGVTVELRGASGDTTTATTDSAGGYSFDKVASGRYLATFVLINFGTVRREVDVRGPGVSHLDVVLHLALSADVTVTGRRTFANLADVENPAENLVGIAQAASQGAITAKQLGERPLMRDGEVLETVPGVIVTQHSGEGKANQYFLRGFNLDHGTDFATTVAGLPVNMPTHAHGQGYTDLNFLIPELVTGVQFSKGPYYADQGDFATAGSSNINYANVLERSIANVEVGGQGFARALLAASPAIGRGHLVAALELAHNDGPWITPDDFRKVNGVVRYSQGDSVNGFSITGMGYRGEWNATDQVPLRAIESGELNRFGSLDTSDGGDTYRYSVIGDWQGGSANGNASTRVTGYFSGYDLDLFSNFTYFLNDPVHGDQIEQADHRFVTGGRVTHRRLAKWRGRMMQNTFGAQLRNDDITNVGLYATERRVRLRTESQDAVVETAGGVFVQNETEWSPTLRTMVGLRADAVRFGVNALEALNSGTSTAALVSPKGGVTLGPWSGTELYVNAGTGFHSNDARGTTITFDADGNPVSRVTPLVRAKGAEIGVRTVAVPHLQSTLAVWMLRLDSELVFSGDTGTTEPGRPSARRGFEWTNYYSPIRWLTFDADVSWSRARFTDFNPVGNYVPEAVGTVVSAGATLDSYRKCFGSVRWRYFGPRALVEDDSVRSAPTSLVNLQAGYRIAPKIKMALDVFNLFDAADSDIDYYYVSRLPGEPLSGIDDIHTHPTPPRTARMNLIVSF
ncbi:MAG TPA: TonB-dependent receptor [Vicinamibacterales bacterium]|jgi:hypothetical protein